MYVTRNGKIFVMVQDSKQTSKYGMKWVYIPEKKWLRMTDQQRARYIV